MQRTIKQWHRIGALFVGMVVGCISQTVAGSEDDAVSATVTNDTQRDLLLVVSANNEAGSLHQIGAHIHPAGVTQSYRWKIPTDGVCGLCNDALVVEFFPASMHGATQGTLQRAIIGNVVVWRKQPNPALTVSYDETVGRHVITTQADEHVREGGPVAVPVTASKRKRREIRKKS